MKAALRSVLNRAARNYAAGEHLDDALTAAHEMRQRGAGVTICYWHTALEDPDAVCERYLGTLDRLASEGLDAHLAMKVPGLWERGDLISTVIDKARDLGIQVDIDSHEPEKADDAMTAVELVGARGVGIAIPGRWGRSVEMADWAAEQGLAVRVVKGSWKDPDAPRIDPVKGFLEVVSTLAGRAREVGVATHNPRMAAESFRLLADAGTPAVQELVYGLPMEAPARVGAEFGVPLRVYIPYGHAWIPYAAKRAIADPRVFYWLARDILSGGRDPLPPARV